MAITPYLYYEDVDRALKFLAKAFGLRKSGAQMRGPNGKTHHAAMKLGGALIMMGRPPAGYRNPKRLGQATQSLYVDLKGVDAHYRRARKAGAGILEEPADTEYGHRRYGATDPEGHQWYFAEVCAWSAAEKASGPLIAAADALARLREGNRRFVMNHTAEAALSSDARRAALVAGQAPFAIVLGCSDSRVPAELVFNQGFGDLFVIRVAGNIVAPSQIGSVEFAAARFDTRLVVVMGHSQCGAITATLEELLGQGNNRSTHLRSIVDRVRPSVAPLLTGQPDQDFDALTREAVRANVRASVAQLRHGSELLEQLIQEKGLRVVGAEYSLETGLVNFFDDL